MQRLPEVQQLVRSLAVENESLREVINRSLLSTLRVFFFMAFLLTAVCSCLAMCAGDAGFAESLQGVVKRKWEA